MQTNDRMVDRSATRRSGSVVRELCDENDWQGCWGMYLTRERALEALAFQPGALDPACRVQWRVEQDWLTGWWCLVPYPWWWPTNRLPPTTQED